MAASAPKFKNLIDARNWDQVRDAWLEDVPSFPSPGARPDPGLEHLGTLQALELPSARARIRDVAGLRRQALWEAIFLFHKCAHTHLASQRLGARGMHSWAMFNAYHSAYLGARSVLSLLGIAFPSLPQGGQLFIDLHPLPEKSSGKRPEARDAREFLLVRLPPLQQTQLWEAFIRAIRVTTAAKVLKGTVVQELTDLDAQDISPPRNRFLYHADFWPATDDLLSDGAGPNFDALLAAALDPDEAGFLLRLSCHVYRICAALAEDLAAVSAPIRAELDESRIIHAPSVAELTHYNRYVAALPPLADDTVGQ
jgi:hypothetical protein